MNKTQTAKLKYIQITPRKVRLVATSVKGLPVWDAEAQLKHKTQRSAPVLLKLLRSAVANAKNNTDLNLDKLIVKNITVDGAPVLKRFMPRAFGRATPLLKRMSHITLILEESEKAKAARYTVIEPEKDEKKAKKAAKMQAAQREQEKQEETQLGPDGKPITATKAPTSAKATAGKKAKREDKQQTGGSKDGIFKKMFRRKSI